MTEEPLYIDTDAVRAGGNEMLTALEESATGAADDGFNRFGSAVGGDHRPGAVDPGAHRVWAAAA